MPIRFFFEIFRVFETMWIESAVWSSQELSLGQSREVSIPHIFKVLVLVLEGWVLKPSLLNCSLCIDLPVQSLSPAYWQVDISNMKQLRSKQCTVCAWCVYSLLQADSWQDETGSRRTSKHWREYEICIQSGPKSFCNSCIKYRPV